MDKEKQFNAKGQLNGFGIPRDHQHQPNEMQRRSESSNHHRLFLIIFGTIILFQTGMLMGLLMNEFDFRFFKNSTNDISQFRNCSSANFIYQLRQSVKTGTCEASITMQLTIMHGNYNITPIFETVEMRNLPDTRITEYKLRSRCLEMMIYVLPNGNGYIQLENIEFADDIEFVNKGLAIQDQYSSMLHPFRHENYSVFFDGDPSELMLGYLSFKNLNFSIRC